MLAKRYSLLAQYNTILLDTSSLESDLDKNDEGVKRLLTYSDEELFTMLRTPGGTKNEFLNRIPSYEEVTNTNSIKEIKVKRPGSETSVAFDYCSNDIIDIGEVIFNEKPLSEEHLKQVYYIFVQAVLFGSKVTDLFVTTNLILLDKRSWLESHFPGLQLNIKSPKEALSYLDIYCKNKGIYHLGPRHTSNRGLWYLYQFKTKIPNYQSGWSYCVFSGNEQYYSLMPGIANRFQDLYRAIDEIGFQYYQEPNNDTLDAMVYHLNYLVSLCTGLLDSLALLTYLRFNMQLKGVDILKREKLTKIGMRNKEFLDELEKKSKELRNLITANYKLLNFIFEIRHLILHREGVGRTVFSYKSDDTNWNMNAVKVDSNIIGLINDYDSKQAFDPLTTWGLYTTNQQHFIEPFHLARALESKFSHFCNEYIGLLSVQDVLKTSEIEKKINESSQTPSSLKSARDLELFKQRALGI